jgi:hypothetical protein
MGANFGGSSFIISHSSFSGHFPFALDETASTA